MNNDLHLRMPIRSLLVGAVLVLLGAGAALFGLYTAPGRTWPSLMLNGFYVMSLALSAMFFLAIQRVTGARWSAALRRIPEAFALALPPICAIMLLIFLFGRQTLFVWTHPGVFDHVTAAGKVQYLQPGWVLVRVIIAFAEWSIVVILWRRTSLRQDQAAAENLALHERLTRYAVIFIPLFAVTFTLAAFDWIVSLDPSWFSTMFGFYMFAGFFVQGIAAITLAAVLLRRREPMRDVITESHLHDLGKMAFAFSTFWAYIWTGQYLLIWYGNIPEEVTHFAARTTGQWLSIFALNLIVGWIIPFIALLSARAKKSPARLAVACVLLLFGHWIDLYQLIMPAFSPGAPQLGISEVVIGVGFLALLYLLARSALARAPLVPVNDPILAYEESVHPTLAFHSEFGVEQ
jgi:hypothetical protein